MIMVGPESSKTSANGSLGGGVKSDFKNKKSHSKKASKAYKNSEGDFKRVDEENHEETQNKNSAFGKFLGSGSATGIAGSEMSGISAKGTKYSAGNTTFDNITKKR